PVELLMVGFFVIWHTHQSTIGGVAPAVIRAGKDCGVALVVAADLHAAVAAGVQEHMNLLPAIASQDDRLLSHARHEVIPRPGDLALVSHKQPGAGEDLLLFLLVERLIDKDFTADATMFQLDEVLY